MYLEWVDSICSKSTGEQASEFTFTKWITTAKNTTSSTPTQRNLPTSKQRRNCMLERCVLASKRNTYKLNRKSPRCYWLILRSTSQSSPISHFPGINTRGGMKQWLGIGTKKEAASQYLKGSTGRNVVGRAQNMGNHNEKEFQLLAPSWESRSPGLSPLSSAASQVRSFTFSSRLGVSPWDISGGRSAQLPNSSEERQREAWLGSRQL